MRPVTGTERYVSLDILRGAALFGVLMVNLLTGFRQPLSAHLLGIEAGDAVGRAIEAVVAVTIEFKAFALFSFLFGVGVAVQAGRAADRGAARFLARRFLVLLGIGLMHMLLFWNGDILTLYAVCGLLLIPFLSLSSRVLAVVGLLAIILPYFVEAPVAFPDEAVLRSNLAAATRVYGSGTMAEIIRFRWFEAGTIVRPLLLLSLPKTLGVMLWGVAAWRAGLLVDRRRFWVAVAVAGGVLGVAGTILHSDLVAQVPLALAYGAAILLWVPRAPWLAAGGQMALTNYVMQSLVFGLVFYSYGGGLFGRMGVAVVALGGVLLYGGQLMFSRWWLGRFRFGPLEWAWRSLTYGYRQPMLRGPAVTMSHGGVRALLAVVFLVAVPAVHGGVPWLLGSAGPRWGWAGGRPNAVNYLGLLPVLLGSLIFTWILVTTWAEVGPMPERVPLVFRPVRLVQRGPYAMVRHPMYVAEGMLWLGFGVFLGSPLVFILAALGTAVVLAYVIPKEERALEAAFGEEYRAYRKRVPMGWRGLLTPAGRRQ